MPLSWEDVANMAVGRIGISSRVTSLQATDKTSVLMNAAIFPCRDSVLEGWDWKCVSTRAQLTKDASSPLFGFKNRYLLPSDPYCLVVREMHPCNLNYVIEGRYLLTDADSDVSPIYIRYTASTDDPSVLTALCLKAIAWRLAAENCNAFIQGNAATGQSAIMREYMLLIEEAQGANQWHDKNHDSDAPYNDEELLHNRNSWVRGGTGTVTY